MRVSPSVQAFKANPARESWKIYSIRDIAARTSSGTSDDTFIGGDILVGESGIIKHIKNQSERSLGDYIVCGHKSGDVSVDRCESKVHIQRMNATIG